MEVASAHAAGQSEDPNASEQVGTAQTMLAWFDRNRLWLFTTVVVLYLAAFTGRWRINPDSAIYMSLGRSLAETGRYVYNGEHHTRYEPGLPLVIAASYRLFGEDRYAPILLFEVACSLAAIVLTYRLMLRHAGRPTAVLITFGFAICQTCMRYGFQVVTDTPFLLGVLAYLLAYEHVGAANTSTRASPARWRWIAWATLPVATLFMVSFRPTALTFVGAVVLTCAWRLYLGPKRLRHVIIAILTVAAFLSFRYIDPRRSTAGAEVKREQRLKSLLTEQRSWFIHRIPRRAFDFVEEVVPKAVFATEIAPGVNTAISLAVMASVFPLLRRRVLWGMWCLGTFAQLVWLPRERYLVPILPLILYGLWLELLWLARRPRLTLTQAKLALATPVAVYAILNLALDVHFAVEQRNVGVSRADALDADSAATLEMARQIARVVDKNDADSLVVATDHDELSYFSRRRVDGTPWSERWPPTKKELADALKRARAAARVYVVLPDAKTIDKPGLWDFIARLDMRPGDTLATVPRGSDRKGKPVEPFTLHRLLPAAAPRPAPASAPTTAPDKSGEPLRPR